MLFNNKSNHNITNSILRLSALLLVILFVTACAASKSKKCDCPTFGDKNKHTQINGTSKNRH